MATKAEKKLMNQMSEYGCVVCRWHENVDDLPQANLHHIRDGTGLGLKDKSIIPLCHYHHQGAEGVHTIGKKTWENKYGTQRELYDKLLQEIKTWPI